MPVFLLIYLFFSLLIDELFLLFLWFLFSVNFSNHYVAHCKETAGLGWAKEGGRIGGDVELICVFMFSYC